MTFTPRFNFIPNAVTQTNMPIKNVTQIYLLPKVVISRINFLPKAVRRINLPLRAVIQINLLPKVVIKINHPLI